MSNRDATKDWVRAILAHRRIKPTELARAVRRAPSTLNRFLNDPSADHDLSRDTVQAIADFAGVEPFELPANGAPRRARTFTEPEAEPYVEGSGLADKPVDDAVRTILRNRNTLSSFVLRSSALQHAGYLPGDVLVVDLNERAKAHDVVCAQVYDWTRMQAETVFRVYEPPYLLSATGDHRLTRPFVIDDDAVIVKGVVMWSLRPRRMAEMPA